KVEQNQNVSKELNNIPLDERARIAHEMVNCNNEDRAKDSKIPKIEITTARDSGGTEHLMDMQSVKDPNAWVFKGKTDVYDLPPACQSAMLFTDGLKMAADTQDSRVIKDPEIYTSAYRK